METNYFYFRIKFFSLILISIISSCNRNRPSDSEFESLIHNGIQNINLSKEFQLEIPNESNIDTYNVNCKLTPVGMFGNLPVGIDLNDNQRNFNEKLLNALYEISDVKYDRNGYRYFFYLSQFKNIIKINKDLIKGKKTFIQPYNFEYTGKYSFEYNKDNPKNMYFNVKFLVKPLFKKNKV